MTALTGVLVEQGTGTPIEGADLRAYRTLLRLSRPLRAYAEASTTSVVRGTLPTGERAALQVIAGPPKGSDFVRIAADELPGGEGWICSRWRATHYALLHDEPLTTTGPATGSDGSFAVEAVDPATPPGSPAIPSSRSDQLFRLRAVHENHRDAESVRGFAALDFHLVAEPLAKPVTEARLVDLLHHFDGWFYTPYRDPKDPNKGRFIPRYPYDIGITVRLDQPHPARTTYDDCCTFVEALLVRAWLDAIPGFSWKTADHDRAMIGRPVAEPFSSVEVLQDAGVADPVDADELPPPWTVVQTWRTTTYIDPQTKKPMSRDLGHTLLIVDTHRETGRLLTLESNHSFGLNGPGFRCLGGVSAYLGTHFRCPNDGYVYDPALGDPDHGVDPGTSFRRGAGTLWSTAEPVPDTWVCPVDGTAKTQFLPYCRPPRDWWASPTMPSWEAFTAYYPRRTMARLRQWDLRWLR